MKFKAWWLVGKWIWISLFFGYSWVVFSLIIEFEEPSSGAVLICACVICELILGRLMWRKYAQFFGRELIEKRGENYYATDNSISISGGVEILDTLKILAKPIDLSRDQEKWSISMTSDRVEFVLFLWIAISLVLGTALWGYGELLFK